MNRFAIARPRSFEQAGEVLRGDRFSLPVLKAGGMDVVDHLKEGLIEPDVLVDIKRLRSNGAREPVTRTDDGTIRIEATATLAELCNSPIIQREAPVIVRALEKAATPQVRNVATAAGNLLQRPRCWYYRQKEFHCLKKEGDRCYAQEGENRYHAIFRRGPCVIVHPSNLAPALYVTGGVVHLTGGDRDSLAISDLFHTPRRGLTSEHNLEPNEVLTHITLGPSRQSGFYAVKEKQSFDWPLAFAAVALEMNGAVIREANVCAGAVAPVPWPLPRVESALEGVNVDDDAALRDACAISTRGTMPLADNGYKVKLLPVVVRRAILDAAGRNPEPAS